MDGWIDRYIADEEEGDKYMENRKKGKGDMKGSSNVQELPSWLHAHGLWSDLQAGAQRGILHCSQEAELFL